MTKAEVGAVRGIEMAGNGTASEPVANDEISVPIDDGDGGFTTRTYAITNMDYTNQSWAKGKTTT